MVIEINEQVLRSINDHGERSYPEEGAGLLLGEFLDDRKIITAILPIDNAREDAARHNRYLITSQYMIQGEQYAEKHELDILGLVILGLMTGIGGGIMRDCILGVQPAALGTNMYFFICLLAAGASYFTAGHIAARWNIILLVDAIGLGVFTAVGCTKAAAHGFGFFGIAKITAIYHRHGFGPICNHVSTSFY